MIFPNRPTVGKAVDEDDEVASGSFERLCSHIVELRAVVQGMEMMLDAVWWTAQGPKSIPCYKLNRYYG